MTGSPVAVGARSRIDTDDLIRSSEELLELTRRLGMLARLHASECERSLREPGATLHTMATSWRQASAFLADAVQSAELLQQRLAHELRLACAVIRAHDKTTKPET